LSPRLGKALREAVSGYRAEEKEGRRKHSPLFTKRRLELIFNLCTIPCQTASDVARGVGISAPTAQWHLDKLESEGIVSKTLLNGKPRYYPVDYIQEGEVKRFRVLGQEKARQLLLRVVKAPGGTQERVAKGMSTQTARKYLTALEEAKLITVINDGRFRRYYPADELVELERMMRLRLGSYWKILLQKLEECDLSPRSINAMDGTPAIEIAVEGKRSTLMRPVNPFAYVSGVHGGHSVENENGPNDALDIV